MKVLFLTNIPSPYRVDFFNELGKYVDLTVCYERDSFKHRNSKWVGDKAEYYNEIFIKSIKIGSKNQISRDFIKIIKKEQFDFIIFSGYTSLTSMISIAYCRFHKIPFYIESDGGFNKKDRFPKNLLKKFLICKAKGHFVTCNEYKNYLLGLGVSEDKIFKYPFSSIHKDEILTEPVCQAEKLELRKRLGMTEDKIVLSVGQFIHRKGFDVLLKAAVNLHSDIGIYIVGGEPTDEYLKLRDSLQLTNVHFVGFKTKEELDEFYMASDLFVLPTREDIWGLVINEAMSKGLPVITTDRCIAGLELVKDGKNGYIIPCDDPTKLAETISTIIRSEKLSAYSHCSIELIKEFTIENMAKTHFNLLSRWQENLK